MTTNPHGFAVSVGNAIFKPISLAVQDGAGQFVFSDGGPVTVPQPSQFFEFPILLPLPEGLNYIIPCAGNDNQRGCSPIRMHAE